MRKFNCFSAGVVLLATLLFSACSAGMYRPGNLQERGIQTISQSPDNDFWEVEEDIRLYRFEQNNLPERSGLPVVVLHGGPGMPPKDPWPGMEELAQTHPVFYYHQRGCGLSSRPVGTFSSGNFYKNAQLLEESLGLTAQIADIERIRQILKRDQLILVGHSFGGFIAALYAAEYPERVKKLVLIEPANVVVFPRTGPDLFGVIEENLQGEQLKAEYREFLADYMNFKDLFSHSEAALRQQNNKLGWYYSLIFEDKKQLGEMPPEEWVGGWMVQALYMSMGKRHDYREFLSRISAETLIIQGSRDRLKMERKNPYTESINSVQIVELDSGHHPAREIPEEFSAILLPFID